jgi:hypothetical protein
MQKILTSIAFLSIFAQTLPAIAVFPDPETYQYITKKYNLLLRQGRDGCAYYADPTLVQGDKDMRKLIVLFTEGPNSGTFCRGMFRFVWLDVNCKTNLATYTNAIGSPANWQISRETDAETTQKICAISPQNLGTSAPSP